jgi:hypothetical protein
LPVGGQRLCRGEGDSDFVTLVAMQTKTQVTLDARAQQRLYVLGDVLAGELTVEEAAEYPKLPVRLEQRYRTQGPRRSSTETPGRVPINRVDAERREQLIDLARTTSERPAAHASPAAGWRDPRLFAGHGKAPVGDDGGLSPVGIARLRYFRASPGIRVGTAGTSGPEGMCLISGRRGCRGPRERPRSWCCPGTWP